LNRESTIREWVDDPRGLQVCELALPQMLERMGQIFGASEKPAEAVSKELMDMPLLSILHFQEDELPLPADDLVDSMLAQVHGRKP
jgi:beta-glucosidase